MPITPGVNVFLAICGISIICTAGIAYALLRGMELLGRLAAVVGITLVLTLLLLVLYQDDTTAQAQEPGPSTAITQAASATANGAP